jgi:hypothetical protein
MTRIRYLLQAFRARRNRRHLSRTESVSFEAFCNEAPQQKCPTTKESSLNGDLKASPPKKQRTVSTLPFCVIPNCRYFFEGEEYVRFSDQSYETSHCTRPSLLAILLVIMLLAVFLILPLIYLLHCFGVIYIQERYEHPTLQEKVCITQPFH